MTETHSAAIELSEPAPTEVPVGATFDVKVKTDSKVQIEAVIVPEEDPDAIWQM